MDMRKRFGVLNEREFRRLYLARAFSLFGDGLVPVALSFAVLSIDPSPSGLGYVLSSRFVSRIGFLLIAGVVADRLPRKHVMIGADLARLLAEGIAATLLIAGTAEVWELVCLFFIYGAGEAFFLPTSTAIVPQTVSPSGLQQANALLAFTTSGFVVLGPIVAGVLVITVGAGWALAIDASTFFFSALFLSRLRVVGFPGGKPHAFLHELREGWREFCSRTWLWVDGVFSALGSSRSWRPSWPSDPLSRRDRSAARRRGHHL